MIEFLLFGAVATGVLYVQDRMDGQTKEQNFIDKALRNLGVAAPQRDKDGHTTGVKFPEFKEKTVHEWGISYKYRLPIGLTYKMLMDSKPLDQILDSMFNKDVEIRDIRYNQISIDIYFKRLPPKVDYKQDWLAECKGYRVIIGTDHKRKIFHDFNQIPHMIIGGMTRYGKSVVMKLLITQLALTRQGVKFHLFDLKGGLAFNRFKMLPQCHSVSRNVEESLHNLKKLKNMIIKRQLYFEEKGYEDIEEAIKHGEHFDRDIIVIDEASVLAPQSKSDQDRLKCKEILEFIAQVAGGLGYNLIMCSQYPTGDILPRQVKQNSDARLSLRLPTSTASNVILDESGAEEIPYGMKGRAIYKTDKKQMIQIPYMSNDMIDELLEGFYANESAEEVGEGVCHPSDINEVGFSKSFAASNDSLFRY